MIRNMRKTLCGTTFIPQYTKARASTAPTHVIMNSRPTVDTATTLLGVHWEQSTNPCAAWKAMIPTQSPYTHRPCDQHLAQLLFLLLSNISLFRDMPFCEGGWRRAVVFHPISQDRVLEKSATNSLINLQTPQLLQE